MVEDVGSLALQQLRETGELSWLSCRAEVDTSASERPSTACDRFEAKGASVVPWQACLLR
jgi:hypothetical protein